MKEPKYRTARTASYALLKESARDMRKRRPTEAESAFWNIIRRGQLGCKFRRQHIIGEYIVDYVCLEQKLVIELDGKYHYLPEQQADDQIRQSYIESLGYVFLRFSNEEILCDTENVISKVKRKINIIMNKDNLSSPLGGNEGGFRVGVIMGSASDLPVMQAAIDTLESFGIEVDKRVISAHRAAHALMEWAESAEERGLSMIIAGAGGAAHLAGVIAGLTQLPVIGVPVRSKTLDGLDSLLSMVQMPSGIPVATVAIDGAKNAALLAVSILALQNASLREQYIAFRKAQTEKVLATTI